MLPHCVASDAVNKAEQIRTIVEMSRPANLNVTVSIGIACLSETLDSDFDRLYKAADEAVYQSKKNGRNCVTLA
jgi:two-component system cell cycle response regulator